MRRLLFLAFGLVLTNLTGCATLLISDQEIVSETAEVLKVLPSEVTIYNRQAVAAKVLYTARTKVGNEYNCLINAGDYRPYKKLVNPPRCIQAGQNPQVPTNGGSNTPSNNQLANLINKTKDARLNKQIEGATPFLQEFLPRIACIRDPYDETRNLLPRYTTSDSANHTFVAPMLAMQYHNKHRCLKVERISDWKSLAKNAISLSVLFVADDSEESRLLQLKLIEQPDGSWLARF